MLTWMELSCSKSSVPLSVLAVPRELGRACPTFQEWPGEEQLPLELTGQRRLLGPASQTVKATEGSKTRAGRRGPVSQPLWVISWNTFRQSREEEDFKEANFQKLSGFGVKS